MLKIMNHVDVELKKLKKKIKMDYLHGHQLSMDYLNQLKQYLSLDETMAV